MFSNEDMGWSYPKQIVCGLTFGLMVISGCKCSCTSKKAPTTSSSQSEPVRSNNKRLGATARPESKTKAMVTRTSTASEAESINPRTGELVQTSTETDNRLEGVIEESVQIEETPTSTLAGENSGGTENTAGGSDGGIVMVEEGFGLPADKAAKYLEEKEKVLQATRSLAGDAGIILPPQQDSGVHPWLIPVEPKTVKRYGIEVERYAPTKVIRR